MVGVKRDVRNAEPSGAIRCGRSIEVANSVMKLHRRVRDHGTRRVHHRTTDKAGVGLSNCMKTDREAEKRHQSRMKRPLVRSQHEFLQKMWSKNQEQTVLGLGTGLGRTAI